MFIRKARVEALRARGPMWLAASAASILLLAGGARWAGAEEAGTKTFPSADDACRALSQAVHDDDAPALAAILGVELTSGAESEARLERQRFDAKYREMHRLVREPDGATRLYVGAENWPFPVPLIAEGGRWRFDTEAGREEILLRRVGHDEATAMRVCEALERATRQGSEAAGDDPVTGYAERLRASAHAGAAAEEPFHGYYFRVVPKHARAQKARGLAFVAYPAEYGSSGVMTFVVTDDGALWEKDIGPDTPTVAPELHARPWSGWHEVKADPAAHG